MNPTRKSLPLGSCSDYQQWRLRRHFSKVVDIAHLSSPVDVCHVSSLRSDGDLLAHYTVSPPVQPWPRRLTPRRLNALIRRHPDPSAAAAAFSHTARFVPNFSHNHITYRAIIERLSRDRAFDLLPPILSRLRSSAVYVSEDAFISLIRALALAGRPTAALRVFLSIRSYNCSPSVRSFNALLNAMVQCRRFRLAGVLFKVCRSKFNIVPNVFSCNILMKALCKLGDLENALQVLDEMPGWGMVPNVVTYTTILGCHWALGDSEGAKKLFDEIILRGWAADATTYTVMIDGYCRHGMLLEAVRIMDEMESTKISPNEVTYSVVIEACCKEKKSGEALNLIGEMLDAKYIPSSPLCCKVIDVLCEDGKVEQACEVWKKLLKKNVTPDNSISSTLIYWLCKQGKVWEAKKLFGEFEKGFIPSLMTYNTLISGMCENGELQEAARVWDDMIDKKCSPNVFTYNVLIKGFCRAGNAKEGIRVLEEMLEKGCTPNKNTYEVIVDGLFHCGESEEVGRVLLMVASSNVECLGEDTWEVFAMKVVNDIDIGRKGLAALLNGFTPKGCGVMRH